MCKYITIICFFFLLSLNQLNAQEKSLSWQEYLKEIKTSADNDNYVYLYYSKGGKLQKNFYCSQIKMQQVVSVNIGDSLFTEAVIIKPDLFNIITENKKNLIATKDHKAGKLKDFRRMFEDPEVGFLQLGIKIDGLHYNHYQRTSAEFIAGLKNEKLKEGYKTVNQIIDIIERSVEKSLAEKN